MTGWRLVPKRYAIAFFFRDNGRNRRRVDFLEPVVLVLQFRNAGFQRFDFFVEFGFFVIVHMVVFRYVISLRPSRDKRK